MKSSFIALIWLRLWGLFLSFASLACVLIVAEPQKLSYFSYLLFTHQEIIKTCAILGIFVGVFFLFYSSSKIPERYLKIKLCQGPIKMHPEMIKKSLQKWLVDEKLSDFKLLNVTILSEKRIGLELKTSNLMTAMYSLEDIEFKLKEFMAGTLGIDTPVDVQLFEL
jgi:hypothetical protein